MLQRCLNRSAVVVALVVALSAVTYLLVEAYAEEPLPFRDPYTGQVNPETEVSMVHFDLTYVIALAAGFSEADSRTLMIWDQLVDWDFNEPQVRRIYADQLAAVILAQRVPVDR